MRLEPQQTNHLDMRSMKQLVRALLQCRTFWGNSSVGSTAPRSFASHTKLSKETAARFRMSDDDEVTGRRTLVKKGRNRRTLADEEEDSSSSDDDIFAEKEEEEPAGLGFSQSRLKNALVSYYSGSYCSAQFSVSNNTADYSTHQRTLWARTWSRKLRFLLI